MKLMARCRDLRDETGAAVVELALIVSIFFVPLILGTTAMAGMVNSAQAQDNSAITTAAQAEASDFVSNNVTVTPTVYYTCNTAQGGTQYSTQTAANLACTSPSYPIEFVQVTVSAPVALPFYCFGIPSSVTLKGESVMEVQGQQ